MTKHPKQTPKKTEIKRPETEEHELTLEELENAAGGVAVVGGRVGGGGAASFDPDDEGGSSGPRLP